MTWPMPNRIEARDLEAPPIKREQLDEWAEAIQVPTTDELALYDRSQATRRRDIYNSARRGDHDPHVAWPRPRTSRCRFRALSEVIGTAPDLWIWVASD